MVAIVAGNGLGLLNTSLNTLGGSGQAGQSGLGQTQGSGYVNAATGNLVLQSLDEQLSGTGADLYQLRTYNAQGQLTDGDADGWRWAGERHVLLTGTVNTVGSTVTRTTGDGHDAVYTWDAGSSRYVSTEGAGAYDTLSWDAGSSGWVWTSGSTGTVERYDGTSGSLTTSTDTNGNVITYSYNASGQLSSVLDGGSGQELVLNYTGGHLSSVDTRSTSGGALTRQVYYSYDASGRLQTVTTDLTPDDNSITDGNVYTTTYSYDGSSFRVAGITQSDGTSVGFTYVLVGSDYRVQTVTDNTGTTTFSYDTVNLRTDVSNSLGQQWSFHYDANGQLTQVDTPAVNGGAAITTHYAYDTQGNVTQVTDGSGNSITYQYDANGNCVLERDALGNTVTRTFDAANHVQDEVHYTAPSTYDTNTATWTLPPASAAQTTRYVYDSSENLRFRVSADGRVTEYRYNAQGLRSQQLVYAGAGYDLSGLSSTDALTLAQMTTWAGAQGSTGVELTDYAYDYRGNLTTQTAYTTESNGTGTLTDAATVTGYVYSQYGQLLQVIADHGSNHATPTVLRSMVYDGLGRLVSQTDAGGTTTTAYDGTNRQVSVTTAAGLTTTQTYDAQGRLVSVLQSATGETARLTSYYYDAAGRQVMVQDPDGVRSYTFYDEAGRVSARVDGTGAVREYQYNGDGQLTTETDYATTVDTSTWFDGSAVTKTLVSQIRPATSADDRSTHYSYDTANRLATTTDAAGVVTTNSYDAAGNLVQVQTDGHVVRYFYDKDGLQTGVLDADGYLRENVYNAAGQVVETLRYLQATDTGLRAAGTLGELRPTTGDIATTWQFYDGEGRLQATVDEQQFVTEYGYDEVNNRQTTTRYASTYALAITTATTYDTIKTAVQGGASHSTVKQFDGLGRVASVTAYDGTVTTYQYDAVTGRLTGESAAYGTSDQRDSSWTYDAFGEQTVAQQGAMLVAGTAVHTVYDAAGRVARVTDAAGNSTEYYYDAAGRLVLTVDGAGDVSETTYDAFGDKTTTTVITTPLAGADRATLTGGLLTAPVKALVDAIRNATIDSTNTYTFNTRGLVATRTDAEGYVETFGYNDFRELTSDTRTLAAGRTVETSYTYDNRGNRTGMTVDVGGLALTSATTYDGYGRISTQADANGKVTTMTYSNLGRTVAMTDPDTHTVTTTYDAFGRVLSVTNATGDTTSYAYDDVNRVVTVTTPEGIQTSTWTNAFGQTVKVVDGNGNATLYSYDKSGNLLTVTDASGTVTTNNTYDVAGRLWQTTTALGDTVTLDYDAANRVLHRTDSATGAVTHYAYDGQGREVTVIEAEGTAQQHETRYAYDRKGETLTVTTDPTGLALTTTYTYDGAGHQLTVARGTTTSPGQQVTAYQYDNAGRLSSETTDPNGLALTTQYRYDNDGHLTRKIDPLGNSTWYTYDAAGLPVYTIDSLGNVSQTIHDGNNRVVETVNYATALTAATLAGFGDQVDAASVPVVADAQHDAATVTVYDHDGRVRYSIDALGDVSERDYDASGNLIATSKYATRVTPGVLMALQDVQTAMTGSAVETTHYVYDNLNRQRYEIDALGYVTEWRYDSAGNVVEKRRYADAGIAGSATTEAGVSAALDTAIAAGKTYTRIAYAYDPAGRLAYTVDALNHVTESVSDALGQVIEQRRYTDLTIDPAQTGYAALQSATTGQAFQSDRTVFDAAGRVIYTVDALNDVTATQYDPENRVVSKSGYVNSIATVNWQDAGAIQAALLVANSQASDASTTRYFYDTAGRLRYTVDALGGVTENTYDAAGHLVRKTAYTQSVDPTGAVTANDVAGLVATRNPSADDALATQYVYDKNGNLRYTVNAGGDVEERIYDAFGNLVQDVKYANVVGAGTYASEQDVTAVLNVTGAETTTHAYDALGRLVYTVDPRGNTSGRAYDAYGNLTSETLYGTRVVLGAAIDARTIGTDLAASASETTHYVYDANGQLRYTVNELNIVSENTYDAAGNVVTKTDYAQAIQAGTAYTEQAIHDAVLLANPGTQPAPQQTQTTQTVSTQIGPVLQASGNEFQINTTTQKSQLRPSIAMLSGGGKVVVWTEENTNGSPVGIFAQIYDASGAKSGSEFQINSISGGDLIGKYGPMQGSCVAALAGGGFVVTWMKVDGHGNGLQVYAKRFDGNGVALDSTDVVIDSQVSGGQTHEYAGYPSIFSFSNGGYAISWNESNASTGGYDIFFEKFSADGLSVGSIVGPVNDEPLGNLTFDEISPCITQLANGNILVSYVMQGYVSTVSVISGVYGRIYDQSGSPLSGPFKINSSTPGAVTNVSSAALSSGGFVSVWKTGNPQGGHDIYSQRFDATGAKIGDEVQVNTTLPAADDVPVVCALPDGSYVVAYAALSMDGNGSAVALQSYDAAGNAVGSPLQVNTYTTGDQKQPALALTGNGQLMVAWASSGQDGDGYGLIGRLVDITTLTQTSTINVLSAPDAVLADVTPHVTRYVYDQNNRLRFTVDAAGYVSENIFNALGQLVESRRYADPVGATPVDEADLVAAFSNASSTVQPRQSTRYVYDAAGHVRYLVQPEVDGVCLVKETTYDAMGRATASCEYANGIPDITDMSETAVQQALAVTNPATLTSPPVVSSTRPPVISAQTSEFMVSPVASNNQQAPSVTFLAGGGSVVVWVSRDSDHAGIFAQIYDANGAAVGSAFLVNVTTARDQTFLNGQNGSGGNVAATPDGGFVVTWMDFSVGNTIIRVRHFDANGNPVSSEINVDPSSTNQELQSTVTVLQDGQYVVCWQAALKTGDHDDIYFQRFSANDVAVGGITRANANIINNQDYPAVTALANGGFVISYVDFANGLMKGQRFDANGNFVGDEMTLNTSVLSNLQYVSNTETSDGGFVSVWVINNAGGNSSIYAQKFDGNGLKIGGELIVAQGNIPSNQTPKVVVFSRGFAIAYVASTAKNSLVMQRYSDNADLIGDPIQVGTTANEKLGRLDVAYVAGKLFVAWEAMTSGYWTIAGQYFSAVPEIGSVLPTGSNIHATRYVYDSRGELRYTVSPAQDGLCLVTERRYDALGRVIVETRYAQGIPADTAMDESDVAAAVALANPANQPASGNLTARATHYVYDALGRVEYSINSLNEVTCTAYDAFGRVSSTTQYDRAIDPLVVATADAAGRAPTAAEVSTALATANATQPRITSYTYYDNGQLKSTTDALQNTESYDYDAYGNRITLTNKNGDIWHYTYDALNRLVDEISPPVTVQSSWDAAAQSVNVVTRLAYDGFGQVISRTEGILRSGTVDDMSQARTTEYRYDALGHQTWILSPGYYNVALGRYVQNWDGTIDPATGQPDCFKITTQITYDAYGRAVRNQVSQASLSDTGVLSTGFVDTYKVYNDLNQLVYDIDGLGYVTQYGYDGFGNQTSVKRYANALGAQSSLNADGYYDIVGVQPVADAQNDRTLTTSYDALGRKVCVRQDVVSTYAYGVYQDRTLEAVLATTYAYNGFGEVVKTTRQGCDADGVIIPEIPIISTISYYDQGGRRIGAIDENGYYTSYSYDAFNQLKQQTEYATRLSGWSSTVPASSTTETTNIPAGWDMNTPPVPVTSLSDDRTTDIGYDAMGRVTSVAQENVVYYVPGTGQYAGQYVANTGTVVLNQTGYDAMGQVISQKDAKGNLTQIHRDALGHVDKVTEPERTTAIGGTSTAAIDPFLPAGSAPGYLSGTIKASPTITYALDAFGQAVMETQKAGNVDDGIAGNDQAGLTQVTRTGYDALGNQIYSIDADVSDHDLNMDLGIHHYKVDSAGRRIEESQKLEVYFDAWVGNRGYSETLRHTYVYDALGHQVSTSDWYLDPTDQIDKATVQSAQYNAFGEVWSQALNGVTQATSLYDQAGHVVQTVNAQGSTVMEYDVAGHVTRTTQQGDLTTTGDDRVSINVYDNAGHVVQQRLPGFTTNLNANTLSGTSLTYAVPVVNLGYDRWGNVVSQTTGVYNLNSGGGDVTTLARTTTFTYDHANRLVRTTQPQVTMWKDDGTSFVANPWHETHYDILGNVVEEQDGTSAAPAALRTRYKEYNEVGQLVRETDASGITKHYAVDAYGNRVATEDGLGRVTFTTYDAMNRVRTLGILRDGNGLTTYTSGANPLTDVSASLWAVVLQSSRYDQAGRLYAEISPSDMHFSGQAGEQGDLSEFDDKGSSLIGNVRYTVRDERNNIVETRNESDVVVKDYYDQNNRKSEEVDGNGKSLAWAYDAYGRQSWHKDLAGREFTDAYNNFGQVISETQAVYSPDDTAGTYVDANATLWSTNRTYTYYENGVLKSIREGDAANVYTPRTDSQGTAYTESRLKYFESDYTYDVFGSKVSEKQVDRDYLSNIYTGSTTVVRNATDTQVTYYSYDAMARLTGAKSPAGAVIYPYAATTGTTIDSGTTSTLTALTYSYDEFGNRRHIQLSATNQAGTVYSQDGWYAYDKEGRVTIEDGMLYNGKVTAYKLNGKAKGTAITYDSAVGNRMTEEVWDSTTSSPAAERYRLNSFAYDDENRLINIYTQLNTRAAGQDTSYGYSDVYNTSGTLVYAASGTQYMTLHNAYGIEGNLSSSTTYDNSGVQLSRSLYTYRGDGMMISEIDARADGTRQTSISFGGPGDIDAAGNQVGYSYTTYGTDGITVTNTGTYTKQYALFDSYKEYLVTTTLSAAGYTAGTTHDWYNTRGELLRIVVAGGTNYTYDFASNRQGELISKRNTGNGQQANYYYVDGKPIAQVGTLDSGAVKYDYVFTPLSKTYPLRTPSAYVVKPGDTLEEIATQVWGDASLWYLLADANGLVNDADLQPGDSLVIPNVDTSFLNSASTFKPYNASAVIGDVTPRVKAPPPPPPPKHKCGGLAKAVQLVVTVVVSCLAGPVIGAAMGDAAGQITTEMANGQFDWGKAAIGFALGGVGGYLIAGGAKHYDFTRTAIAAAAAYMGNVAGGGSGLGASSATAAGTGVGQAIGSAAASNVTSQGLNMAFGRQDSFSWSSFAYSAFSAGVGAESLKLAGVSGSQANWTAMDWATSAAVNFGASAESAYIGDKWLGMGSPSYKDIATDAFGNTLASYGAGELKSWSAANQAAAQAAARKDQAFTGYLQDVANEMDATNKTLSPENVQDSMNAQLEAAFRSGYGDLGQPAPDMADPGHDTVTVGAEGTRGLWGVAQHLLGEGASNADIKKLQLQLETANPGVTVLHHGDTLNLGNGTISLAAVRQDAALDAKYQDNRLFSGSAYSGLSGSDLDNALRNSSLNRAFVSQYEAERSIPELKDDYGNVGNVYVDRVLGGATGVLEAGWDVLDGLGRIGGNSILQIGDILTFGMNHDSAIMQQAWAEQGGLAVGIGKGLTRLFTDPRAVVGDALDKMHEDYSRAEQLSAAGDEFGASEIWGKQAAEIASTVLGGVEAVNGLAKFGAANLRNAGVADWNIGLDPPKPGTLYSNPIPVKLDRIDVPNSIDEMGTFTATGSEVFHGPSVTRVGSDGISIRVADNTARIDGVHDVVVHGTPYDDVGAIFRVDSMPTNANHIADAILAHPEWNGQPIRLLTCYGGCGPAQELSNILRVPVQGATGPVGIPRNIPDSVPIVRNGQWLDFFPEGN